MRETKRSVLFLDPPLASIEVVLTFLSTRTFLALKLKKEQEERPVQAAEFHSTPTWGNSAHSLLLQNYRTS